MKWYKEVSKFCLNLAAIVFAVFIFGFVSNPKWKWTYLPLGVSIAVVPIILSKFFWQKGGED